MTGSLTRGVWVMAKIKNKRNRKRVKLYKKVRHVSSWGTLGILLFLNILFVIAVITFAGFFCQYLMESKLDADYLGLLSEARIYEKLMKRTVF